MSGVIKSLNPVEIISKNTSAQDDIYKEEFLEVVKKCYKYAILKPFLDLVATVCAAGRLEFEIFPKEFYMLDEGNCKTFRATGAGQKRYIITIRKISADVVIHEIGHMLENEAEIILDDKFNRSLHSDLTGSYARNKSLQSAIKDVMIDQVRGYPENQRASELFTRFFQLLAMSKEIAGFTADYGYKILDFYQAFPNMSDWLADECYAKFSRKINPEIATISEQYIVPIEEIKHKWSGDKVKSFHGASGKAKTWRRSFKSIKDD